MARFGLSVFRRHDKQKTVCIVGLGGLGSAAALLLQKAADCKLILIDHDKVELSNLQRQWLYEESDLGAPKALALAKRLTCHSVTHIVKLTEGNTSLLKADVVLDCTDNLEARYIINKICIDADIPLVHASVAADRGFIKYINRKNACLQCFYKKPKNPESSQNEGVLNTAVHMAASMQVHLALLSLEKRPVEDRLINFDVWRSHIRKIIVAKDPHCIVCGAL
jgi:molybdopterin/thiamine biosynthesis adenylyltransferase